MHGGARGSGGPQGDRNGNFKHGVWTRENVPPFRYRHMGDLATIGRRAAVVKLGRLELTGFLGWLFWSCFGERIPSG
jgi:NADH dehydrogenase FAD-containing subunit